jgi:hypothetical protein
MCKIEVEPARKVRRWCGHNDLVEALGIPDLLDRHEWIGVAHNATRRDPGAAKAVSRGAQATTG